MAILAFLMMYLAPGTSVRMGAMPEFSTRILRTLMISVSFGGTLILNFFTTPAIYAFLLFLPSILNFVPALNIKSAARLRGWHICLIVAAIAPLMESLAGWATLGRLPLRAENLTLSLMALAWIFLWSFCYRSEAFITRIQLLSIYRLRGALLALCLLLSANFMALISDLKIAPLFRSEIDARQAIMEREKSEGNVDIILPLLTLKPKLLIYSDLRWFDEDAKGNMAYAIYHGLRSVRAFPSYMVEEAKINFLNKREDLVVELLKKSDDPEDWRTVGDIYESITPSMPNVPKDDAMAAFWYLKAAEHGDKKAIIRLSRLYATGTGVEKDYFKATCWLLRAQL